MNIEKYYDYGYKSIAIYMAGGLIHFSIPQGKYTNFDSYMYLSQFSSKPYSLTLPELLSFNFSNTPPSVKNDAHGTEKFMLKSQVKILHSEVNLII